MGAPPYPPEPDVAALEHQLSRHRRGVTPGQAVFDVLFGALTPFALLWADPALFTSVFRQRAALPPYWAGVTWWVAGFLALCLVLWLATGARRTWVGILVAGPFAFGFVLAVALGAKLLLPALGFGIHPKGLLALSAWFTAFVYGRNGLRAVQAGADASAPLAALSLIVGTGVLLAALGITVGVRRSEARLLEDQLFSTDRADYEHAVLVLLEKRVLDPDDIARRYDQLPPDDPRRPRVAEAYHSLTGEAMASALRRLGLSEELPPQPDLLPSTATPAPDASWPPYPLDDQTE